MGTLAEKFAKPPTPPPEAPPAPTPLADAFAEPSREVNVPTRGLTTDPLVLARMHKADAVYQQAREVGASEEESRRQSGEAFQTGMAVGDEADSAAVRSQLQAHEGPDATGKMLTRAFGRGVMVAPLASPGKEERDRAYEQRVRENDAALGGLGAVGALASAVKGEKAEAAPLAQEQQSAWLRKALTESANWLAAKSSVAHGVSELWDMATGEPLFGEAPTTDELLTTLRQSSEEMKADPNMQALQLVPREGEIPGAQGVRVAGAGAMLAARALSKTPLGDVAGSLRKGLGLDEGETLLMWDDAQNREAFDQATADLYSGSGTRTAVDALPIRELPARLRGATIDIPAFQAAVAAGDPDLAPLQKAVGRGDDSWIGVIESLPVDVAARYQPDLRPTDDELHDAIKARHAAAKWSGAPQAAALENLMVAGLMKPLDNGKDALFVPSRFQDLMRVMAVPFAAVAIEPDIHPWTLVSGSPVDAPEQGDTSLTAKLRAARIPTVRGVESLVESGAYNDWLASAGLFGGGDGYNAPLSGPSGYLARVLSDAAMGDYGARGYEDIYERAGGDPHSAVAKTLSTIDLALQFLIPAEDVVTVPMGATLRAGNRARAANRALRELGVPAKDARIAAVGSAIGPWVSSATDPIQALGDSTRTLIHDRFKSGELDPDALTPANLAGLKDLFVSVGVKDPDATLTGLLDHLRDRRMRVLDTAAEGLRTGGPQTRALRDSRAYKDTEAALTRMVGTNFKNAAERDMALATLETDAFRAWDNGDIATPAEYFERQMWTKATPEEEAAEAAGREGLGEGTLRQTVTVRDGSESMKRYGLEPGKRYTNRQVAEALEKRQRAKYGSIAANDRSPEARNKIAKWMRDEVLFAVANPKKSGVGWYSTEFQKALTTLGEEFPELADDADSRDLMTALIAITSDGTTVPNNFRQAMDLYAHRAATGSFLPEGGGGSYRDALTANLGRLQDLYERKTPAEVHQYLMKEITVADYNKAMREAGRPDDVIDSYQGTVKIPRAAAVFGPKLGAFYANLMGAEGYLTMDRWWSRTFNRYRGTLLSYATEQGKANVKAMLGNPDMPDDELMAAIEPIRKAYEKSGYKDKTPLNVAANTVWKNANELEDSPFGAPDRTFMIDTVREAQRLLNQRGHPMSAADIQAILWYYEKRLYGELGARNSLDATYSDVARSVIDARRNRGVRPGGPGVAPDGTRTGVNVAEGVERADRVDPGRAEDVGNEPFDGDAAAAVAALDDAPSILRSRIGGTTRGSIEATPVYQGGDLPDAAKDILARLDDVGFVRGDEIAGWAADPRMSLDELIGGLHKDVDRGRREVGTMDAGTVAYTKERLAAYEAEWAAREDGTTTLRPDPDATRMGDEELTDKIAELTERLDDQRRELAGEDDAYAEAHRLVDQLDAALRGADIGVAPVENVVEAPFGQPRRFYSKEGGTTRGSIEAVPRTDINPQGFYSALRRAVSDLRGERFTADQLRATLRNTPGVKADEIEWTRLDQFLADHPKPTKAEVVDWLDENAVVVEEKTLGATPKPAMPRIVETAEDADRVSIQLDPAVTDVGGTWELWKDPVDGDYGVDRGRRGNPRWFATKEAAQDFIRNELADSWQRLAPEPADRTQYGAYQLPGGTNYREVLFRLPEGDGAAYRAPHFGDEGANLLAHMRVNDRVGPNGEKILHIEEVQSDWHQAGREKGYRPPPSAPSEVTTLPPDLEAMAATYERAAEDLANAEDAVKQHGRVIDAMTLYNDVDFGTRSPDSLTPDEAAMLAAERERMRLAGVKRDAARKVRDFFTSRGAGSMEFRGPSTREERLYTSQYSSRPFTVREALTKVANEQAEAARLAEEARVAGLPPEAPLSKTWHELALKRALRMAAEGGYDGVSWTRGVEQVKRYEDATRAAVDEVKWRRPAQDVATAETAMREAQQEADRAWTAVYRLEWAEPDDPELIAASQRHYAAQDALERATENLRSAKRNSDVPTGTVEVLGLKNGREVYRETMPPEKVADVLGKGMAAKIMESPEASGSLTGPDLTIGGEGMRGFYDAKLRNDANKIVKPWGMRVGETVIDAGGPVPVHYLPLTDAGKRAILTEGLPLFSREGGTTRGAITPVPTTKDVPNPARESWVAEGRAAAERVKALEKADAERLAQLEAKRDALRAIPTQGAETPEWQAWKAAQDERASLRTQKEALAKNPRAEDPEWAADLEDVTERLDAMPDPGPEPVRFAPGEAPPELLAAEQAVADFKPSPEYAAAVAELAQMRKAPPTKSLTVPDRARWLIRLFKTGDILTAFHEGAHLAALMGPEWERMAARVFDSVDGKLTVKGHEQLAEASVRILRGKFRPGSVVDNLTQDVLDAVGDVWRRVRSKPFVEHVPQRMRRALDALPDNAIPAEFARMWDQQFSPERMATAEAVHIVDGQGRAFPAIVNVEDTPGARVLESKSSRAGQAQTATSITRNPEEVRVSLGLKAGEQSVDPVEFLSNAMAYLATERFRRAWGASGPLKMLPSGRTAVPEARHAKVIADADARRVAAMGGRPSPIQGTNDLALTPGQQAGLRRVVREVADSPLGDALPASLTEPGADLSRIAAEDYNTLTALHTDLSAGWGAWRETRAERAATSGATRILTAATDYARKTDAKPAIDSVQRAFDSSFGVNEAMQPHQAEFMRSIQRELAAVPAQVDAAIAQTAQEWRKGGTKFKAIDLVRETAKGIPPEVVPPDYVDDLAQVEPLLLNGTLEGVAASAEQIDNLFAKTPLDDSAGDMRIIESDAVRRLDDLHRAFMETNDMEAALAATGETPRSASDAMQIVTEGIRRRSASVQDIGRDITLTFFGSNDLTGVEKLQDPAVRAQVFRNNYVRWFEGDWVGILDDIESMRGGVSGQKYDQGSAALSVTIRLNARKVLRDAAGRMAAAGLTGDVVNMARNRGGKGAYTAGKLAQGLEAFQADVASYIATISGWTVGQQGFVDDAGQFVTLGGAGRRTARGVEDPVAYDEACRQMARFGVKPTNVTSWDAMDMPGGGRILAPRFVLDNIKTVLEEAAPLDLARKERLSFDPRVGDIVPGSAAQRPPTADVKAINAGIYVLDRMWGYSGAMLRRGLLTGIGPIVKPAYFVTQFVGGINALHQRLGTVGALRVLASPVIGGSDATVVRNVMARLYGTPDILSPTVAGFWTKDGRWITDQMISADMARSGMVTSQPKAEFTTSLIENIAAQEPTAWNNLNRLRLPGTRAWREMVDNAATGIDNMYRVATYVDALKSGVAVEEAGRIARDVAYDFNDLTDFEKKYMRKAVLFYTFQRRNQDAFWRTLLNNPARLTGELRLLNGLQRQELGEDSEIYANPYGDGRLALRFRDALVEGHAANAQRGALTISPGLNVGDQVGLWLDILGTAGGLLHGEVDRASVGRLTGRLAPGLQAIPAAAGFDVERMRLLEDTPATVPQVVVDTDYALSSLFTTYDDEMLGGALTRDVFQARPVRPWDDADAPTGSGLVYEVNRKDPGAAFCWWAFNNLVPYGAVATQAQNYERAAGVIAPRAGVTQGEEAAGLFGFRTTPVQSRAKVLGGLIDRRAKELEDEARAAEATTIVGPRE